MPAVYSPRLNIMMMASGVLQPDVIFNEAILSFDALVGGTVLAITTAIPVAPSAGDTYIIGAAATGVWAGKDNDVSFYYNGWQFLTAPQHMKLFNAADGKYYTKGATAWVADPISAVTHLSDLLDVSAGSPATGQALVWNGADTKWEPLTLTFAGLPDVAISGIADGQLVAWHAATGKFIPYSLPTYSGGSATLSGLTDVMATDEAEGKLAYWHGGKLDFISATTLTTVASLANVGDVSYGTGLTVGEVLAWNGAAWAPSTTIPISFAAMSDGPGPFAGKAGKSVRVDALETGLEYFTPGSTSWGVSTPVASYVLQISDAESTVRLNSASAINCVVPPNSAVAFAIGTEIELGQIGAGALTVVAGAGVTLDALSAGLVYSAQFQYGRLRKEATDTWSLVIWGSSVGGGGGAGTLAGDTDVVLSSLADGQALIWSAAESKWINTTLSSVAATTLAGDTDVAIASPANGQGLLYDAALAKWTNQTIAGGGGGGSVEVVNTPPLATDWTTSALHGAVATNVTTTGKPGFAVQVPSSGSPVLSTFLKPAPTAAPYYVTAKIKRLYWQVGASWMSDGVVLYNSANGRIMQGLGVSNGVNLMFGNLWNSDTSFNSNYLSADSFPDGDYYTQLYNDGATLQARLSIDGVNFVTIASVSLASFLGTVTHVGLGFANGCGNPASYLVQHFHAGADPGLVTGSYGGGVPITVLNELTDVNVAEGSAIDGKFLKWDQSSGKWVAAIPALTPSPAVSVGAHRYWRFASLIPFQNDSNAVSLSELTPYNNSMALTVSASKCNYYYGGGAYRTSNLFDGNTGTIWAGQVGCDLWMDFGAPVSFNRMTWYTRSPYTDETPMAGIFQFSDDGMNFTTVSSLDFGSAMGLGDNVIPNGATTYTFNLPTTMQGVANPLNMKMFPPTSAGLPTEYLYDNTGAPTTAWLDDAVDGAMYSVSGFGALAARVRPSPVALDTNDFRVAAKVKGVCASGGLDLGVGVCAAVDGGSMFIFSKYWWSSTSAYQYYIGGHWSGAHHDVNVTTKMPPDIEWVSLHFLGDGTVNCDVSLDGKRWVTFINYNLSSTFGFVPTKYGVGVTGANTNGLFTAFYSDETGFAAP